MKLKVKKLIWNKTEDKDVVITDHVLSDFCLFLNSKKEWELERLEDYRVVDRKIFTTKALAKKAAQDWIDREVLKLLETP